MVVAVVGERGERLWVQPRYTFQDLRLDVIHGHRVAELHPVVFHRGLLEFGESLLHDRAVVRFSRIPGDPDPVAANVDAVLDLRQFLPDLHGVGDERPEGGRAQVVGQVLAQAPQTSRGELHTIELGVQRSDRPTIEIGGVEQPSLTLQRVVQLLRQSTTCPHRMHALRELRHRLPHW